jgi:hydrogenase nickel incorporation protein HypB
MSVKVITIQEDIMEANDQQADLNQVRLNERGVLMVNIMSSPGSGKTSLITQTIENLKNTLRIAVIEGDIASTIDAEHVSELGIPVIQINTAGGCHLDANMIKQAFDNLPIDAVDLLFIENVGNLVCPAEFFLGEHRRAMLLSLPEGHDKPWKYPLMFTEADVVLLNKTDLSPYLDFDREAFRKVVAGLNPSGKIFPVSCKTGEGLDRWYAWLKTETAELKKKQSGGHSG